MTIKVLQTRRHNERATNINLHGGEAKYIDTETEKMLRIMEEKNK